MIRWSLLVPALLVLAACASPQTGSFSKTRADAMPYDRAHARCWEEGMGAPVPHPNSTVTRMNKYDDCMNEHGWDSPAWNAP